MWLWVTRLASPKSFYHISGKLLPYLIILTLATLAYGLIGGLFLAPPDYQQGDGFRIIYLHVPCAFLSLLIYSVMAGCATIQLVWRIKLAGIILQASVTIGAWFTFLALITGSIWGKPMWGTWWIWDARLTSELILLFLYLGVIALLNAIPERDRAIRAASLITLVGFLDIPIIHYSVYWWNTLHQGATLSKFAQPSIAPSMLYPLLAMITAAVCYYLLVMLIRARTEVLTRERDSQWVRALA